MEPVSVPRLETERTLMRGWEPGDAEPYARWMADPEVARFIGGVIGPAEAWRRMATHAGHWQLRGYGAWAVERKQDHALIGRVGLWNPAGWPGLEVGWTLAREAWGQGYAQETARAAIDWAWQNLDAPALISVIDPGNAGSIKVAERMSMRFREKILLHGETPALVYELQRPA